MQLDKNGSPFLALPAPHSNLILTPPLITDGAATIAIQNNPAVYMNLSGLPHPYTQADWNSWFPMHSAATDGAIEEWKAAEHERRNRMMYREEDWAVRKWIGALPLPCIREVDPQTGEQTFVGDVSVRRQGYLMVLDGEERKRAKEANHALAVGDPSIEWEVGFYLSPDYHGRGIMPIVLKTVIDSFFVPYFNGHHLTGSFFEHNGASKRVFEKCGFVFDKFVPEAIELAKSKTGVKGKRAGLGRMKWEKKTEQV